MYNSFQVIVRTRFLDLQRTDPKIIRKHHDTKKVYLGKKVSKHGHATFSLLLNFGILSPSVIQKSTTV